MEDTRSYDQDPRFGASVLTEIASRALSPAVNDPGTAIDVINRALRVLAVWDEPVEEDDDDGAVLYPNVHVPPIRLEDLFDDLFTPIARDGAGIVEVGLRLQKALAILARFEGRRLPRQRAPPCESRARPRRTDPHPPRRHRPPATGGRPGGRGVIALQRLAK